MFKGTVLGSTMMGMSGCGGVVIEVTADAKIPQEGTFREFSQGDKRLVECIGDWRPCRDTARALKGREVEVGLDDLGMFATFKAVGEEEEYPSRK
jgi:hypothetical protein